MKLPRPGRSRAFGPLSLRLRRGCCYLVDYDYANDLSNEDAEWLRCFTNVFYSNGFGADLRRITPFWRRRKKIKDDRMQAYNSAYRDVYAQLAKVRHRQWMDDQRQIIEAPGVMEDLLIEMIDRGGEEARHVTPTT